MKNSYKRLGDYINEVKVQNGHIKDRKLLGINIDKFFMPSVANVVGTDLSVYKIVRKHQFACNRMHVGRDYKLPVSMSTSDEPFMVSPAYDVFEIRDQKILSPEYLMMWFSRKEFDRNAWFYTDADVRGGLHWKALCDMRLPIPDISKQCEIVKEYKAIQDRIDLNNKLIQKLEETAQAIYKRWFVEFKNEKSGLLKEFVEINPTLSLRRKTMIKFIEMANLSENSMCITGVIEREYNGGSRFQNNDTLLARITPCLENGKTAFVNVLSGDEIAAGSTEFIVLRAKKGISPFWVYCLAKDEIFRSYAISSMVGSSGRQRVHEKYLEEYKLPRVAESSMLEFDKAAKPLFEMVALKSNENQKLSKLKNLLLSKLARIES
jgi:type I restriction enzyme S subunit